MSKENNALIDEAYMRNRSEVLSIYRLFLESIKAVKLNLISCEDTNTSLKYLNERAFAYELYRQITNRLYSNNNEFTPKPPIVVNAEIYKCVEVSKICDEDKEDEEDKENRGVYPDIVIHGGQYSTDKQILICEIKKEASSKGIAYDVKKLLTYMDYDNMFCHPFPLAVFVNVGSYDTFVENLRKVSFNKLSKGCLVFVSYDRGKVKIVKIINSNTVS